jgi:hypothetical protein
MSIDPVVWCLVGMVLFIASANLWLLWLYIQTYRRLVASDRDRDRLIRRIGVYHSLPLTTPYERMPEYPPETPIPPSFRMKRPQPPVGWRPDSKDDL